MLGLGLHGKRVYLAVERLVVLVLEGVEELLIPLSHRRVERSLTIAVLAIEGRFKGNGVLVRMAALLGLVDERGVVEGPHVPNARLFLDFFPDSVLHLRNRSVEKLVRSVL